MNKMLVTILAVFALAQSIAAAEANWLTDLSKAQAEAKKERKLVLLDFTGSDWCPPCKQMHKNVLSTSEFADYAKDNLVLVMVDFPHFKQLPASQKTANEALRKKFGVQGYPTTVVLDAEGKELSKTVGYQGESAKEFVANLKKLKK
jgi:protein disulfide-isomerase